jgi:hypothetical protein
VRLVLALVFAALMAAAAHAHHGAADYDVSREVTVDGAVREWRWSSPHTWVMLTVTHADGKKDEWSGEGPPLQWAESRGWSKATLKAGETVRLVMYPSRREPHAGLVKRIERAGGNLIVSRPWLDGR